MNPLFPRMLNHAFLSGFVAAREIPPGDECDGTKAWTEYEPHPNDLERLTYLRVVPGLVRLSTTANVNPVEVESVTIVPRSFETGPEHVSVAMKSGGKHRVESTYNESVYQLFDRMVAKLTVTPEGVA